MPLTTLGANDVLASILAQDMYLALCQSSPSNTDTGSTIPEISGSGYVRKLLTPASWSTPVNGTATYTAELSWTVSATWVQTAYAYALCSALTAGDLIGYGYISTPTALNVTTGSSTTVLVMAANSLVIEVV